MSDLVIRPLAAGEENLFESMPDPLPQLRQVGYADGIAGGGYRPENTWVALRAAHETLGGPRLYYAAMPAHWRRRPEVLAVMKAPMAAARLAGLVERGERLRCSWTGTPLPAASGRYAFRPAIDAAEINALVARIARPDVLTGR